MPAPTLVYKVITSESQYTPDVTQLNELASQGWELVNMMQIGGGAVKGRFWYLLSRKVTNIALEEQDGR